ncbi:TSUP family transporter [Gemmatimonas sp.]|uniref:TSUP family transporter n=1 Tax=Gemmatimonas sp. TaxID=1962908 RepID=UPI00286E68F7|nr:TSUP family transporter [Gemmatimonas sp.]
MIPLLIVIGVGASVLSDISGIGGGILMVPPPIHLAKLPSQRAGVASLAAFVLPLSAALGASTYYRTGHLQIKDGLLIAIGMTAGAFFGAQIAMHVDAVVTLMPW